MRDVDGIVRREGRVKASAYCLWARVPVVAYDDVRLWIFEWFNAGVDNYGVVIVIIIEIVLTVGTFNVVLWH